MNFLKVLDVIAEEGATNHTDYVTLVIVVIGVILLVLILAFLILFPILRKRYMYKNFKGVYYRKIKKIVEKNDYLLLNNVVVKENDILLCTIDHIIFGKKYIYVIKDRFYRGALSGKKNDSVWLFFNFNNEKSEIHNPLMMNKSRIEKLCGITGMDDKLFVSIVLVNNDCVLNNPKEMISKRNHIVSSRNLGRLIRSFEKSDVKDIDPELAELACQDIYRTFGSGRIEEVEEEDEL